MTNPDSIHKQLVKQSSDLRAEVVVAELLKQGLPLDEVSVFPLGTFERGFRRDVLAVEEEEGEEANQTTLFISREGLYDMLPLGLFHEVQDRNPFKSSEQMVEEIKKQKKEEQHARTFFAVLEAEFNRHRILVELAERKFLLESTNQYNQQLFSRIWGEAPFLNIFQQTVLLHLLPFAHELVGNYKLTAQCLEILLGERVKIELIESQGIEIPDSLLPILNEVQLGIDFALGVELDDGVPVIEVSVGPLYKNAIPNYLENSEYRERLLSYLYGYFLPAEATVQTSVLVEKEYQSFKLALPREANYLGYTTCL